MRRVNALFFLPLRLALWPLRRPERLAGCLAAIVYAWVGVLLNRLGVMGDAYAHAANAAYVLWSRDPHLTAIGLGWEILPSVLNLPLVALRPWIPALVQDGLASVMQGALFGGLLVSATLLLCRRLGLPRVVRYLVTTLVAANPAIAFFCSNGMSDTMMTACLVAALERLFAYLEPTWSRAERPSRNDTALLWSASWVILAFLTRYEALVWAGAVQAMVALGLFMAPARRVPRPPRPDASNLLVLQRFGLGTNDDAALLARDRVEWIGGQALLWMVPLVYALTTWCFINWSIMGDAFYFVKGGYGNAAQLATGAYASALLTGVAHHLGASVIFSIEHLALFPPTALTILLMLWKGRRGDIRALALAAASGALVLFHAYMFYSAQNGGWLRYYISVIPFGACGLAYALIPPAGQRRWLAPLGGLLLAVALVGGDTSSAVAMFTTRWPFPHENLERFNAMAPITAYLDAHPRLIVLTDSFTTFPVIMAVKHPRNLVITSDEDFHHLLLHPQGYVGAILAPQPIGLGTLDAVNVRYPHLWTQQPRWVRRVIRFHTAQLIPIHLDYQLYLLAPARREAVGSRT